MIRRPPKSTRTDTLFPYTTLFRSASRPGRPTSFRRLERRQGAGGRLPPIQGQVLSSADRDGPFAAGPAICDNGVSHETRLYSPRPALHQQGQYAVRSEERRVGKEWVSTCRSRLSTYN